MISVLTLIVVGIDRYAAVVHPLVYEARMTYGVIKCMIAVAWLTACLIGCSFWLWLINANRQSCSIVPLKYHSTDIVVYVVTAVSLIVIYGRILQESIRQRAKIAATELRFPTQSVSKATPSISGVEELAMNSISAMGFSHDAPSCSRAASQPQQPAKSRRREYKAVYLTATIVGVFVVLWLPYMTGRCLLSAGDTRPVVANVVEVGGGIGIFFSSINWIIYAAVSRSFRRAYGQMFAKMFGATRLATLYNEWLKYD